MAKKRERKSPSKDRLIQAALEILERKAPHQINYRDIADRAGLSHMTAYRQFKTLDDLFEAIAEKGYIKLMNSIRECIEKHGKAPKELLEAVLLNYFHFADNHPHFLTVMFDRGRNKGKYKKASFLEATQELFEEYLKAMRICKDGKLFPAEWSDTDLALLLWSFSHGYSTLELKTELKLVMSNRPKAETFIKKASLLFSLNAECEG